MGALHYVPVNPEFARKAVGRTNAEGVWEQVLYWTNPWGLAAEAGPGGAGPIAVLRADVEAGELEVVPLTLPG